MAARQETIPDVSKEMYYVPGIQAFDASSSDAADPTSLPVQFAFLPVGTEPTEDDWHAGTWTPGRTDQAQILLDFDALGLAAGSYRSWLRVTGAIEQPARPVGYLRVSATGT